jgi:hypothetical protein
MEIIFDRSNSEGTQQVVDANPKKVILFTGNGCRKTDFYQTIV